MAKIIAPNADFNGESASVKFEKGVGETDDPNLITWFTEKGYKVEKVKPKTESEPKEPKEPKEKEKKEEAV